MTTHYHPESDAHKVIAHCCEILDRAEERVSAGELKNISATLADVVWLLDKQVPDTMRQQISDRVKAIAWRAKCRACSR